MTKELFNDLWTHLEEEATQKDNFQRYMFKPLESTLWLREAWLQGQYHGPQAKMGLAMMIGMATAIM